MFALGHEDDLVRLVARVEALQAFLKSEDGTNLLAGYKRAANILKAEEKKDGRSFIGEGGRSPARRSGGEGPVRRPETGQGPDHAGISAAEDFAAAMRHMAALRKPVDAFFDGVKVNAEDAKIRENRLHLLASLRAALHQIADFSRIEGE